MYVATFESTKTEANVFRLEGAAVSFFWKKSKKEAKRAQDLPPKQYEKPRHTYSSVLGVALPSAPGEWSSSSRVFWHSKCCKVRHIIFFLG